MEMSREELKEKLKNLIDQTDEQIATLEKEAKNAEGGAKERINSVLSDAREERRKLSNKAEDLTDITDDQWEKMKDEAYKSLDTLQVKMNDLMNSVKYQLN
ncbi:MAG: hypothetical protein RJQ09_19130 [Cyclobacteriaceae bacterium]